MKEVFEVDDVVFSSMVAVGILVANVWMAVLLFIRLDVTMDDAVPGASLRRATISISRRNR